MLKGKRKRERKMRRESSERKKDPSLRRQTKEQKKKIKQGILMDGMHTPLFVIAVVVRDIVRPSPLPSFLPSTYRNPVQHWQQRIFLFRCIQINGAVRTSLATVNMPAAGIHPGADQDFVLLS